MSRVAKEQKGAHSVLDWLYVNQILVHSVFNDSEREWLRKIVECIDRMVSEAGATGLAAEAMKHYAYCLLEIYGADQHVGPPGYDRETLSKLVLYHKKCLASSLIDVNKPRHEEVLKPAFAIAYDLLELYWDAPGTVRHRFADRVLAYEFPYAPLDLLLWLEQTRVVTQEKYDHDLCKIQFPFIPAARIGMAAEFELLRNAVGRALDNANPIEQAINAVGRILPEEYKRRILDYRNHIDDITFLGLNSKVALFPLGMHQDPPAVARFFATLAGLWCRPPVCVSRKSGWVSMIGSLYVERMRKQQSGATVYSSRRKNEGSITAKACALLDDYGFPLNERVLNDQYQSAFQVHKEFVTRYYQAIAQFDVAPSTNHPDHFYYGVFTVGSKDPALSYPAITPE